MRPRSPERRLSPLASPSEARQDSVAAKEVIRLRFMGHVKTSVGSEEMVIERERISVDDLFGLLLSGGAANKPHGFSKYNTLLVVNDEEVFSPSSQKERLLKDGDTVLFVPFSHGG